MGALGGVPRHRRRRCRSSRRRGGRGRAAAGAPSRARPCCPRRSGAACSSTDAASCSTASSGEVGRASGSSASGPSGVVVMSATLPGRRDSRSPSVGCGCPTTRRRPSGSFPRSDARTHGSPGARRASLSWTRPARGCFPALAGTAPTRSARCGRWTSPPAGDAGRRPARAAGGRGRAAVPGRAGPARAQPRGRRRASSATPPTGTPRSRPSRSPAGCGWPTSAPTAAVRELPAAGAVIDPRPDPTGTLGRLRRRRRRCTSWASDGTRRPRPRGRPRRRTSPGAWPSSSPPRRWAATAATGGRPTATRVLAARVDESPVQRWYIADPAQPVDAGHRGALPGGRQRRRRGDAARPAPRRRPRRRRPGTAPPSPTSPPSPGRRPERVVQVMSRDQRTGRGPARSTRPPARPRCCSSSRTRSGSTSSPASRPCCRTAAW